ncbi:hypothetical protein B0H13DRAFT_2315011 [Mycena leptocephala]|nr:hypothetical protein B0H13DRAFT_2315011 [Mycena leptocephala]
MSIVWHLEEIQSPVAGRKSSPGGSPRPIDPPPVVRLLCSIGGQYVDPHDLSGFNINHLACSVDLFRLPDAANPRMKWSYYARDGTFDQNNQPVYALFNTDHPERQNEIQQCIGNHLLLESSKETHLLHRQVTAQAHEIGDAIPAFPNIGEVQTGNIIFAFPNMGVLQTGQYLLRYTVYNKNNSVLMAKCFGQRFTISTVNRFPGLQPPTPLTQLLATLKVSGVSSRN